MFVEEVDPSVDEEGRCGSLLGDTCFVLLLLGFGRGAALDGGDKACPSVSKGLLCSKGG